MWLLLLAVLAFVAPSAVLAACDPSDQACLWEDLRQTYVQQRDKARQFSAPSRTPPPSAPPFYLPPPNIQTEYDRLLMQQFLQQQFKDQVDRETGQGRYQRR